MNSNMTPIDWAKRPLQKYADFSGRAPRAEYWWFYLFSTVAVIITMVIDSIIGSNFGGTGYGIVTALIGLALILPSIAVGVRRLHDTDRSGWWLLIAFVPLIGVIVLLVFLVTEGTLGDNRYGPNPYGAAA
jgi:uncharacterized membrane protein YhaH (DUF805 family)